MLVNNHWSRLWWFPLKRPHLVLCEPEKHAEIVFYVPGRCISRSSSHPPLRKPTPCFQWAWHIAAISFEEQPSVCKLLEGLSQKVVTDPDVFGGIDAARNVSATGAPAIHEERGSGSSGVTFLELFRGWVKVPRRFPTNAPEAGESRGDLAKFGLHSITLQLPQTCIHCQNSR